MSHTGASNPTTHGQDRDGGGRDISSGDPDGTATAPRPPYRVIGWMALLVAAAAGLSVSYSGGPAPWAPFALIPAMLDFKFGGLFWGLLADESGNLTPSAAAMSGAVIVAAIMGAAFVVWSLVAVRAPRIPKLSAAIFTALAIVDVMFLVRGWNYGVRYQGQLHTLIVIAYNVAAVVVCTALYRRNSRMPSLRGNAAFHAACFAAAGFCALPWLGELP